MTFGELQPGDLVLEIDGPSFLVVGVDRDRRHPAGVRVTFLSLGESGARTYAYDQALEVLSDALEVVR